MVRLSGLLPDLTTCAECGSNLNGDKAYFHPRADGLLCPRDRKLASGEISEESRELAAGMLRAPVETFAGNPWPRAVASDLRKFFKQRIEMHVEKKLVTAAMLERLE
jgi:recombinational DNA repair protein (RecF pathway)